MKEEVGLTHAAHFVVKISAFVFFVSAVLLYFGKQLSDEDQQLLFFNYDMFTANITTFQSPPPSVEISPNDDKTVARKEVHSEEFVNDVPNHQLLLESFGVVDENGVMSNEFRIGDFGDEIAEILSSVSEDVEELVDGKGIGVGVGDTSFFQCPKNMKDYVPCLDNVGERDSPEERKGLDCLIPRPKDYRSPVLWPKSRDEV